MTRTAMVVEATDSLKVKNNDIPSAKAANARQFWGVKDRAYQVANPSNLSVSEGDMVEIYLPPGRTLLTTGLLFLLPLAFFPLGFFLAGILFPEVDEGSSFLLGFLLLLFGLPIAALIRRILGRCIPGGISEIPKIVKVIAPDEPQSCKHRVDGCGCHQSCGE